MRNMKHVNTHRNETLGKKAEGMEQVFEEVTVPHGNTSRDLNESPAVGAHLDPAQSTAERQNNGGEKAERKTGPSCSGTRQLARISPHKNRSSGSGRSHSKQ